MFDLPVTLEILARGFALTAVALLWVIVLVRVVGLRSFSKMTAFDFVATLALGSLLATGATADSWRAFAQTMVAMAFLLLLQWMLARGRKSSPRFRSLLENQPLLLMEDGRFVEAALHSSRVSRADVLAKIRAANAPSLSDVRAVVLETTGDISVLHGDRPPADVMEGVRRLG